MLLSDEEYIEIRPEGAAHVGEEEVDRIQRQRVETLALGRCHSDSHSVPITRVRMVSGAPTLK